MSETRECHATEWCCYLLWQSFHLVPLPFLIGGAKNDFANLILIISRVNSKQSHTVSLPVLRDLHSLINSVGSLVNISGYLQHTPPCHGVC